MRNFKKVMALAVSMAAICTSVSAFAELEYNVEGDVTGTYAAATNSLTLAVEDASGDKTVLVLDNGVVDTAATGDDILYINQYTDIETAYENMGLKGTAALAAGTYAIKVGYTDKNGDFAIKNASLVAAEKTVTPDPEPETETITVKWGDITGDDSVDGSDSMTILMKFIGVAETQTVKEHTVVVGDNLGEYKWGDVTGDGSIDGSDSMTVLMKFIGVAEDHIVNEKTITVGSDVDIVIEK